ncbi:MAG: hydroxyacid dehydrogenase, partial [Bacteroidetes bacterium]|nr:hydroxyacid dehydrogenase [Bacteroidota bacterium]
MKIVFAEPIGMGKADIDAFSSTCVKLGHTVEYPEKRIEEAMKVRELICDADILVVEKQKISVDELNVCNNLKMLTVAFTGYDQIDVEACTKRNIVVANAPGYSTHSVAELTIGMIISSMRKMAWGDGQTRILSDREGFLGRELFRKTIGIIGTGTIGSRVAEILQVFECKVLAYSPTKKNIPGVTYTTLDDLLKRADVVTLHIPLNEKTHHLIGERELKLMKNDAVLINTARGLVVDYQALAVALHTKEISAAAVDIY